MTKIKEKKEYTLSISKLNGIISLFITFMVLVSSIYGFYNWMLTAGDQRWAKIEIVNVVHANTKNITLQELYRQRTTLRSQILDYMERLKIDPDNSRIKVSLEESREMLNGINDDIRRLEIKEGTNK